MKKLLTICALALFAIDTNAQTPTFDWANHFGGTSHDGGSTITLDASGNVYTTGGFSGTADFDPGPGTFNLSAGGFTSSDPFISKLDASGNFVWAKQLAGTGGCGIEYLVLDASGNIYTTGTFDGTTDFDPGPGTYNLTTTALDDIFISKFDSSGNFVWAKQMGGFGHDRSFSIALDASGNVYTTGVFQGTADFDPGPGTYNLTSNGNYHDIFISRLDASGNFVWAKQMGGTDIDVCYSIALDASGNVYTTGEFYGTVDFDPGPGTFNLASTGSADIFISKLDASGNFLWAKQFEGSNSKFSRSFALDALGNVYNIGYFEGIVDFDPGIGIFNLTSIVGGGIGDIFISKLDSSGNFVWAKQFVGNFYSNESYSLTVDGAGNVYTTGTFSSSVDFDPGSGTFYLTAQWSNPFILKLNTSGNFVWAVKGAFELRYGDEAPFIAADASGNVFTTGYFEGTADFDPGTGTYNLTSAGLRDVFILKLSQCTNGSTDTITSCDSFTWIDGNTYTTSNNTATLTLTNTAGCDSVVTLNLTINTVDNSVTQNGINLSANQASASYQWLDCDNNFSIISSAINQTFTATANGNYAVQVIHNLCTDTSTCFSITTVGILENDFGNDFRLYPNPTNGMFQIEPGQIYSEINVSVKNSIGQEILSEEFRATDKIQIYVEGSSGIYIVHITTPDGKTCFIKVSKYY